MKRLVAVNPFKIGADPEFAIISQAGNVVTFPYDDYDDPVGADHGGRVVELRPAPSRHAHRMVRNINKLLVNQRLKPYRDYKWKAGGIVPNAGPRGGLQPLGGHIHLDLDSQYVTDQGEESLRAAGWNEEALTRFRNEKARVKALDNATRTLEHLDILSTEESAVRRSQRDGYGRFSAVRPSNGRIEYRTPISWLYSPVTTFAALTCTKLAAHAPDSLPRHLESYSALRGWLENFVSKDSDAARLLEEYPTLKSLQKDPSGDLKKSWPLEAAAK